MTNSTGLSDLPVLFNPLNIQTLPTQEKTLIAKIDQVLPQTQCGLCGHIDGCLPYAYGIVIKGEAHNLCVPGGQAVTDKIYELIQPHQHITPLAATPSKWQNDPRTNRPIEVRAVIDEDDCIGCTKCIPACPVDAIIGTAKHMHSIITDLCTGCELCLPPCPVDCIRLVVKPRTIDDNQRQQEQQHLRQRYHQHLNRVAKNITAGNKPVVSSVESAMSNVISSKQQQHIDKNIAKNTIELAKLRTQIKKLNKQLSIKHDEQLRHKLDELTHQLATLEHSAPNQTP